MLINAFSNCINALNPIYTDKNTICNPYFLLFDFNNTLLETAYISDICYKEEPIENSIENINKYIDLIKLRKACIHIPLINDSMSISGAPIMKTTGEIIAYLLLYCKDSTFKSSSTFIELLSRNIFFEYKILLLKNKFGDNYKNIKIYKSLSKRENDIIELILQGKQDKEISKTLCISPSSVRKYLENIFNKTDVNNRTSLCITYYKSLIYNIINS